MKKIICWLGKNRIIATLIGVALYLAIVAFHDEITLIAIKWRNSIGLASYNAFLACFFLTVFILILIFLAKHILKGDQRILKSALVVFIAALTLISFRFLMTYNIEAIHFVEYMLVAIILLPVLRSYGETVFWVTVMGIFDEIFQYHYLTPNFEYFDFNDCFLNLAGAGAGAILVFISAGGELRLRHRRWYNSIAFLSGTGFTIMLALLIFTGISAIDPTKTSGTDAWFTINRAAMPDAFWKEAYPGRIFHILSPGEGILLLYLFSMSFFCLDHLGTKAKNH